MVGGGSAYMAQQVRPASATSHPPSFRPASITEQWPPLALWSSHLASHAAALSSHAWLSTQSPGGATSASVPRASELLPKASKLLLSSQLLSAFMRSELELQALASGPFGPPVGPLPNFLPPLGLGFGSPNLGGMTDMQIDEVISTGLLPLGAKSPASKTGPCNRYTPPPPGRRCVLLKQMAAGRKTSIQKASGQTERPTAVTAAAAATTGTGMAAASQNLSGHKRPAATVAVAAIASEPMEIEGSAAKLCRKVEEIATVLTTADDSAETLRLMRLMGPKLDPPFEVQEMTRKKFLDLPAPQPVLLPRLDKRHLPTGDAVAVDSRRVWTFLKRRDVNVNRLPPKREKISSRSEASKRREREANGRYPSRALKDQAQLTDGDGDNGDDDEQAGQEAGQEAGQPQQQEPVVQLVQRAVRGRGKRPRIAHREASMAKLLASDDKIKTSARVGAVAAAAPPLPAAVWAPAAEVEPPVLLPSVLPDPYLHIGKELMMPGFANTALTGPLSDDILPDAVAAAIATVAASAMDQAQLAIKLLRGLPDAPLAPALAPAPAAEPPAAAAELFAWADGGDDVSDLDNLVLMMQDTRLIPDMLFHIDGGGMGCLGGFNGDAAMASLVPRFAGNGAGDTTAAAAAALRASPIACDHLISEED